MLNIEHFLTGQALSSSTAVSIKELKGFDGPSELHFIIIKLMILLFKLSLVLLILPAVGATCILRILRELSDVALDSKSCCHLVFHLSLICNLRSSALCRRWSLEAATISHYKSRVLVVNVLSVVLANQKPLVCSSLL